MSVRPSVVVRMPRGVAMPVNCPGLSGLPYPYNPTILGWNAGGFGFSKTLGTTDTAKKLAFWNALPQSLQQEFLTYQNYADIPGLPGYRAKALLAPVANGSIYSGAPIYAQGFGVVFTITSIKHPTDFGQIGPYFNAIDIAAVIKQNVDKPGFWISVSNPNFHKDMTLAILAFTAVVAAGAAGVGAPAAGGTTATAGTTAATTAGTTAATTGTTTALTTGGTALTTTLPKLVTEGTGILKTVGTVIPSLYGGGGSSATPLNLSPPTQQQTPAPAKAPLPKWAAPAIIGGGALLFAFLNS